MSAENGDISEVFLIKQADGLEWPARVRIILRSIFYYFSFGPRLCTLVLHAFNKALAVAVNHFALLLDKMHAWAWNKIGPPYHPTRYRVLWETIVDRDH
jgi:hypothetical protein